MDIARVEAPLVQVRGQYFQVVLQRAAVGVEVDKNEPAPFADLGLWQAEALLGHVFEIPLAGYVAQLAIQRPGKTVERAAQLFDTACLQAQCITAVQAGVVVGAYFCF